MPGDDEAGGGRVLPVGEQEGTAPRASGRRGVRAGQGRPTVVVPEMEVARVVAAAVGADRVAVTLASGSEHRSVVRGSDPLLVALADREQSLGEGPTVEALATGRVARVADLHAAMDRWPVLLTTHVASPELRSLLVLPLDGPADAVPDAADVVGVLVLARSREEAFAPPEEAVASRLAALLSLMLQVRAWQDSRDDRPGDHPRGERLDEALDPASDVLPLAVGQLMAGESLSEEDALGRLEHRAFTTGTSVYDAARDVVARTPPHQRDDRGDAPG